MSKKKFNEAEFKEFCKEAIPHIEALQKLLEKRDMENLGSLNFSAASRLEMDCIVSRG